MRLRTICRVWVKAVLFLVCGSALTSASRADTYKLIDLGSDAARFLYGIDDAGTVVLNDSATCAGSCYFTYIDGAFSSSTPQPPALVFNNGDPCTVSPAGYVVQHATCNGGRIVWTGFPVGEPYRSGVFDGPDALLDRVTSGGEGVLMLNGTGDFVFDDHFTEKFYVALNTTVTPEPASLVLLLTGTAFLVANRSRRRNRAGLHLL